MPLPHPPPSRETLEAMRNMPNGLFLKRVALWFGVPLLLIVVMVAVCLYWSKR